MIVSVVLLMQRVTEWPYHIIFSVFSINYKLTITETFPFALTPSNGFPVSNHFECL